MDSCPSCDAEFPDFDGKECKCGYRRRPRKKSATAAKKTQSEGEIFSSLAKNIERARWDVYRKTKALRRAEERLARLQGEVRRRYRVHH